MIIYATSLCNASRAERGGADTAPDPTTHPILSKHWFGIEPLHPIGPTAAACAVKNGRNIITPFAHSGWPAPLYEGQPNPEPPGSSGNRAVTRDSTA